MYVDDYCEFKMTKTPLTKCGCPLNELLDMYFQRKLQGDWSQPLMNCQIYTTREN